MRPLSPEIRLGERGPPEFRLSKITGSRITKLVPSSLTPSAEKRRKKKCPYFFTGSSKEKRKRWRDDEQNKRFSKRKEGQHNKKKRCLPITIQRERESRNWLSNYSGILP
ncbi:hypothetical protein AVEN_185742-1 [Araneus ventricosus]|uniref:Uncharacterized protein n=1 Tax=Araneus ventricosus TaxID=182803 RepID=A0A4Y2FXT2_ARAVE|nr:hypothetical protein AVEN_185742-1 [Araneus ventricosus]